MNKKGQEEELGQIGFDHKKNQLIDLWFHESAEIAHGCQNSIKIKEVLCHYHSRYQEIAVFETERLGRMLVLDNITMLTEFDEFAYHEMIVHVPLLIHPAPHNILIIGGGDGGTVREVLKHPEVQNVHVCEIDEEVVKVCRKFLPSIASGLDDKRVRLLYEDGAAFIRNKKGAYDVIIVDSTDPVGPGKVLFQREFYEVMKEALNKDGIAVTQCESIFFHQDIIRSVFSFAGVIYPKTGYYYTLVPTYPSGIIGFFFCSLKYDPLAPLSEKRVKRIKELKYYTPEIHRASFVLPRFASALVERKPKN